MRTPPMRAPPILAPWANALCDCENKEGADADENPLGLSDVPRLIRFGFFRRQGDNLVALRLQRDALRRLFLGQAIALQVFSGKRLRLGCPKRRCAFSRLSIRRSRKHAQRHTRQERTKGASGHATLLPSASTNSSV